MKSISVLTALVLTLIAGFAFATETPTVQGEYIEARSASVYVGACHFGAEFVEGGREATSSGTSSREVGTTFRLMA